LKTIKSVSLIGVSSSDYRGDNNSCTPIVFCTVLCSRGNITGIRFYQVLGEAGADTFVELAPHLLRTRAEVCDK
jgi:hypothetical protein